VAAAITFGDFPLIHPDTIEVGVGELALAQHPKLLITLALGSCVGISLWDATLKQGGLAHVMLPHPPESMPTRDLHRFASVAVPDMVRLMAEKGSARRRLVAKIAGGAAMFASDTGIATIGDRNVAEAKRQLELLNIPLIAEDTGGGHARTVELHLDTGAFRVRSYLYGIREL
jgi:chemotaxis protein CheD